MIKPILIKSNDIGIIGRYSYKDKLILRNNNKDIPRGEDVDIILIDTKAEIKEGDKVWGSKSETDNVYSIMEYTKGICSLKTVSKIIASTNKNHNLPKLSDKSIELLVAYYNKNKCMPESVDVDIDKRMIVKIEELADYFNFDDGTRLNPNFNKIKLNKQGEVDIYIL